MRLFAATDGPLGQTVEPSAVMPTNAHVRSARFPGIATSPARRRGIGTEGVGRASVGRRWGPSAAM